MAGIQPEVTGGEKLGSCYFYPKTQPDNQPVIAKTLLTLFTFN